MTKKSETATRLPVIVVVPPRLLLLDIAGPIEALRKANLLQNKVTFDLKYVSALPTLGTSIGLDVTGLAPLPAKLPEGALVVLPGTTDQPLGPSMPTSSLRKADASTLDFLTNAILPGHKLVAICSGALLAARAGLLDGYHCTTHHACIDELSRLAPKAKVLTNRLFVDDRERMTSAGITAGIDLALHIISKAAGPAAAMAVARYLVVYLRRGAGDPQLSPWFEGRNHIQPVIHRAQDAIAADPARDWDLETISAAAATSRRTLTRLFMEHTGMSVNDYLNRLRLALARNLLETSTLNMEQIADFSGFSSARQLRRAWSRVSTAPPSAVRPLRNE